MIFNFLASRIDTETRPDCPKCGRAQIERQVSLFAAIGRARKEEPFAGMDENRMEHALESLMREAGTVNNEDPRQLASLMRTFSDRTGINLGDHMEEAIARMEKGDDPDQIEKEMGDLLSDDETFSFDSIRKKVLVSRPKPARDDTLYELKPAG